MSPAVQVRTGFLKVITMLRSLAAALVLSLATGAASAASFGVTGANCDGSSGLWLSKTICTISTHRGPEAWVYSGTAESAAITGGAYLPPGRGKDILVLADPAFRGSARFGSAATPNQTTPARGGINLLSANSAGGPPPWLNGHRNDTASSPEVEWSLAPGAEGDTLDVPTGPNAVAASSGPIPIPLPATVFLPLGGLSVLGLLRRRRRANA